nr:MAG TPA: hypothetical protein [Caudoviricetes sp.]
MGANWAASAVLIQPLPPLHLIFCVFFSTMRKSIVL